jgi:hypothetical protein
VRRFTVRRFTVHRFTVSRFTVRRFTVRRFTFPPVTERTNQGNLSPTKNAVIPKKIELISKSI